ncbi:MAG: hypothetical protein IPK64_15490 [bacterium]|nr:hypothetical protein [bacterium]
MKKLLTICVLVALSAGAAHAGLDPDGDSMGIYFDPAGNSNCITAGLFTPVNAYLLLANPTAPTDGFGCTLTLQGGPHFVLSVLLARGGLDVDASANGYMVATTAPYPVFADHSELLTMSVMLQGPTPLYFFIGPNGEGTPACRRPVVGGPGGERCCGVSSGDVLLPVASVNGAGCPVADESSSFGAVKALYR